MSGDPVKEHYRKGRYWSHLRVHGYANQLLELHTLAPARVLEIGRADGFMSAVVNTFTTQRLVSLDLDPALDPDVAGSVLDLPFRRHAFDAVLCCQVLEHLPFDRFDGALAELARVSSSHVIVSVPDVRMYVGARLRLPKIGSKTLALSLERPRMPAYEFDGEHHWEIGYAGTRFNDVKRKLTASGLRLRRTYRLHELPYHSVFVLTTT